MQDLLGDALTEVQHCKELQFIDSRSAVLLQEKAQCAAAHADFVYTDLTQSSTQVQDHQIYQFALLLVLAAKVTNELCTYRPL